MNKTLLILKHEFQKTVRTKSFIILTIAFPLLAFLAISGFQIFSGEGEPSEIEVTSMGYVDNLGIMSGYTSQYDVELTPYVSEDAAKEALLDKDIDEYVVIPTDYVETGLVLRYTLERELEPPSNVYQSLRAFLVNNLLEGKTTAEIADRALYPLNLASVTLDETGEIAEEQGGLSGFIIPYAFGILLIMAIFSSSGYMLQGLSEEKENRIMEILLSSVSTRELITGKVLGLGAAGLLQIIFWLVSAQFLINFGSSTIGGILSEIKLTPELVTLSVIYFILGYLLFAIIMAGAGAIASTAREGQQMSVIFTLTAVVPFWLAPVIIENPNGVVAQVLTFIPFSAPVAVMMRTGMADVPLWQIIISIALLIGTIIGSLWIAAKVFRIFLLMYGKTPKMSEILRYLKNA